MLSVGEIAIPALDSVVTRWIAVYPVDSIIQPSNNRGKYMKWYFLFNKIIIRSLLKNPQKFSQTSTKLGRPFLRLAWAFPNWQNNL